MTSRQSEWAVRPADVISESGILSADLRSSMAEAGVLMLRLVSGILLATLHGWHKLVQGWQFASTGADWPLLDDTRQLGFPLPVLFAALAALIQFLGGWLLAIGAGTRIAAFMVGTTLIAAWLFNLQSGGPDAQLAGLYTLVCGAFAMIGGGRWSVDGFIGRRR